MIHIYKELQFEPLTLSKKVQNLIKNKKFHLWQHSNTLSLFRGDQGKVTYWNLDQQRDKQSAPILCGCSENQVTEKETQLLSNSIKIQQD